jgi:hypothetical protein
MEQQMLIGIDPGSNGCAILMDKKSVYPIRFNKHEWPKIAALMANPEVQQAYIEAVGAMRRDKPRTAFIFGQNTGIVKGILFANSIPFVEVHCSKWQKHFGLGGKFESRAARKKAQHVKAQELFPLLKVTADMADALLIAKYGYDTMSSNS